MSGRLMVPLQLTAWTAAEPAPAVEASAAAAMAASPAANHPRFFIRIPSSEMCAWGLTYACGVSCSGTRRYPRLHSDVAGVTCQRWGARSTGTRPTAPRRCRYVCAAVPAVVEAIDLHRTYKTTTGTFRRRSLEVEAVRGVSFEIEEGELFGLLGPNGAGKTTTIKMLITLLIPTSGQAKVLGRDVVEDAHWVRERIGYVFGGDRGLYERLSALDNLRYFAELYGVDPHRQRARIGELLELVGLDGREKERVEGYSRGMRQRLHIARGLLHDPPVLFLDEPTIGVDPVGARELRATIGGLKEAGKTVLLTTHYMFEADALCDRIAVVAKGKIVAEGTPRDLKEQVSEGVVVEIEVYGIEDETVESLRGIEGVTSVAVEDRDQAQVVVVQARVGHEPTHAVLARLDGVALGRVTAREPTLEDAYVALVTEQPLEPAAADA